TITSCAAWQKVSTPSAMPAALSTTIASRSRSSCEKACTRPTCWAGLSSVMWRLPEAAGTTSRPLGVSMMVSRSSQRSANTSARVWRGARPSITSTLARPRSVSSSRVRWPALTRAVARLTETEVLPTPPLPLAPAITRTGPGALSAGKTGTMGSGDCMAVLGGEGVIGSTAGFLQCLDEAAGIGGVEIRRHLLALGGIGKSQAMAGQDRQRRAELAGLVELGQHHALGLGRAVAADHFAEVVRMGIRRQHQQAAHALGRAQPQDLAEHRAVARGMAGGVDQHQRVVDQLGERVLQPLRAF